MRRFVDIMIALGVLLATFPVLLVTTIAVPLDSPGSPFYPARRIGQDGKPFTMWKFRTMVTDADRIGPAITGKEDSRVTRIGRFLRRTKIDELPQFYNLLVGDLTLVGPRPEAPEIVDLYSTEQRQVLALTPGITGAGSLDYLTRRFEEFPEGKDPQEYYIKHIMDRKLKIDLEYEHTRTMGSDIRMLFSTLTRILASKER